jgi:hypothetical protein
MKKTLLVIAALAAAATLRAQSFESQIIDSLRPYMAEDTFADVGACGVLDIKTIRPFNLDEASDLVKPCIEAVARKYGAKAVAEAGFLSAPQSGLPAKAGLIIKTDLNPGSEGHRALVSAISRREGRLLGHMAKVMTKDEAPITSASALQHALNSCTVLAVVRDIRSGEDFLKIYGKCLSKNPELMIKDIQAAEGLAITVSADAPVARVDSYNGFLTVNAGKGPIQIRVIAFGSGVSVSMR